MLGGSGSSGVWGLLWSGAVGGLPSRNPAKTQAHKAQRLLLPMTPSPSGGVPKRPQCLGEGLGGPTGMGGLTNPTPGPDCCTPEVGPRAAQGWEKPPSDSPRGSCTSEHPKIEPFPVCGFQGRGLPPQPSLLWGPGSQTLETGQAGLPLGTQAKRVEGTQGLGDQRQESLAERAQRHPP